MRPSSTLDRPEHAEQRLGRDIRYGRAWRSRQIPVEDFTDTFTDTVIDTLRPEAHTIHIQANSMTELHRLTRVRIKLIS